MGAIVGFFTDYQHKKWFDALFCGVQYTPPATLYLGLMTTPPSRGSNKEVSSKQTVGGFVDFSIDMANDSLLSSTEHEFEEADKTVIITGGGGWIPGTYPISSIEGSAAALSSSPAGAGTLGGTGLVTRDTGYSRVTLASHTFRLAQVGVSSNVVPITFPAPTGDWGVVKAIGFFDSPTDGNMLAVLATTQHLPISAGDPPRSIAIGALIVSKT